ncbi:Gldg family protein [Ferrovibrio sp.]|uniref:Gldg family protein n=1 Tax=Ferrovibrio sp. TaxID=1917215 RepID=UPI0025BCF4B8|nr:Gldg family protein [Ferrovibrio sp.]MBX3453329.1 Gldg family protein [Ferrovibrio sp.]
MTGGKKTLLTSTGLIAAFALFFAVNLGSNQGLRDARLDLTQARLYTLSDGTRNVLKNVQEPITLRFFFSDKVASQAPQLKQYGLRVRELLERYATLSGGKIRLEVIDPEPFSEAEDRAVQAGVQGIQFGGAGQNLYFGLVGTNSVDKQEIIPFFQAEKEQFLEYDLTKLVYGLTNPKKPTVGILGELPLEYGPGGMMAAMRGQAQPYLILGQIKQFFDVKMLEGKPEQIDDKIDLLLLAHPKGLSDELQYAVDQFVLKGGRLIVFADPYSETMAAMPNPMTGQPMPGGDSGSLLPKLFQAWGVDVAQDKFVADLTLAQRVQTGRSGPAAVVDYLPWLAVPGERLSHEDVITADLTSINFASVGSIKKLEGGTTSVTPLIRSSDKAMLMDTAELKGDPNPQALAEAFKPTGEIYTLAARITGPAKTAFPDGPPKPAAKEGEPKNGEKPAEPAAAPAPQIKESAKPINVILVADADLLDDRFWVRTQQMFGQQLYVPISANADMVVNAIDNMSGSGDLIGLRSRGKSQRPFEVIDGLRREADRQFLARERELQKRMEETEKKIADLQSKSDGAAAGNALITAEQQAAIEQFRADLLSTRKELRDVQRELNRDIERLQLGVKFINIGLMPLLAALVAIGLSVAWRRRRVARRVEG